MVKVFAAPLDNSWIISIISVMQALLARSFFTGVSLIGQINQLFPVNYLHVLFIISAVFSRTIVDAFIWTKPLERFPARNTPIFPGKLLDI